MQKALGDSVTVRKHKQVQWKCVDGSAVILHFGNGNYFALDPVGTHLWTQVCKTSRTIGDLIEGLQSEYDCSEEQARKDTLEFCGQLLAEKLLETNG